MVIQSTCLTEKLPLPFLGENAALAIQFVNKYRAFMSFDVVRPLLAVVLTLSLTLGPAVNGVQASSMGAKMAMISLSDGGNCNDCPESKSGLPLGACSVCCTGVAAVSADVAAIDFLPGETQGYLTSSPLTDRHIPPDPHPPRSTVLS